MERKYGKKMKHSTKIQRTKILPLRWIGNFLGEYAGNHLVKAVYMDEDGDFNWRYTYHAKMWKILNWPYKMWGTYYLLDIEGIKKDLEGSGWDDYDEFGKAYWDKDTDSESKDS